MATRFIIDLGREPELVSALLLKEKIKITETYARFVIAEASESKLVRLLDRKLKVLRMDERRIKLNGMTLGAGDFSGRNEVQGESKTKQHYLLAFAGPVKPDWTGLLKKSGAELVKNLPGWGALIETGGEEAKKISELSCIAWITLFPAALKISPALFGLRAKTASLADLQPERITKDTMPEGQVLLLLFRGAKPSAAAEEVKKLGGVIIASGRRELRVEIEPGKVFSLAALKAVEQVHAWSPDEYDNDISATISEVDVVRTSDELDGDGQVVANMDTGLDTGVDDATLHLDFQGRIDAFVALSGRTQCIDSSAEGGTEAGHGTHTSGTIFGDGSNSAGQYKGMAPAARIVFMAKPSSVSTTSELSDAFDEAYSRNARMQNNSWGKSSSATYDSWSQVIDQYIWDNRDFLPMFSAGNSGRDNDSDGVADLGSLRHTGAAKNCLCVGGSENNRPSGSTPTPGRDFTYGEGYASSETLVEPLNSDHFSDNPDGMFYHSSRGPTSDGRIKPDVVAPATNVLSSKSSLASVGELLDAADPLVDLYEWCTGTSMSTPAVTGCVALTRQYLVQRRGHESSGTNPLPSAALLKAIIINGAYNMSGQYTPSEADTIPNPNEGWGRLNINRSLFPQTTGRVQFSDYPEYSIGTGETRTFHVHVHDSSEPLRVTLVWTDSPGSGIINELYLQVEAPDSTVYDGDYNDDGTSNPYADVAVNGVQNNVQQVTIDSPATGQYTITVTAVSVTDGITPPASFDPAAVVQDFAIVVSNGTGYSKQPVAIMQVIDRSGSMGYYGYMEPAKLRAQEFADILQINDKGGVVSFNSTASLDAPLTAIASYDDKQTLKDAIEPLASGGTTSIGAGLELAQAQFTSDSLPHAILLLSDGFSNTAPYEYNSPDGSAPVVDATFIASGTVIYSVALGSTADTTRLQDVATATGGQFYEISGYSDIASLQEIYYNVQALASGDDIVELDSDEVSEGETNTHEAGLDGDSDEAFFGMSSDSDDDNVVFSLIDPSGKIYKPSTKEAIYRAGEGYRFYRITRPRGGKWKIVVSRKKRVSKFPATLKAARVSGSSSPLSYTFAVLGQSQLFTDWQLSGVPVVGKPLDLSVVINHKGRPVTGARIKAVTRKLDMPLSEYVKKYRKQLDAIKLTDAVKADNKDMARLTILDKQMSDQGRGLFNYVTSTQELKETAPGVYSVSLPAQKYAGTQKINLDISGTYGRDPKQSFSRKTVITTNIREKVTSQAKFRISPISIRKKTGVRPGDSKFVHFLSRKPGVAVFSITGSNNNPVTASSGIRVSGSVKLPDGKSLKLDQIFYSPVLGGYYILLPKVKGEITVNVKASLGQESKTATAKFLV